ncbi:hypothetical protein Tco_0327852 [Tanacetum coccineum]
MESQSETTQTMSALKLPVLKTGEYDLWSCGWNNTFTFNCSCPLGAWNNIALIMRNKSDLDTLSMDDLYNNLKVYESEIKGQTSSNSNSQNVAFVSSGNSNNTNETVNTAHTVSAASSKDQASTASYADDVMFSFFANQSNAPQLDNEDLEQIDVDDLEEMDLKWQVAMLTIRVKRFIKKTRRKLDLNGKDTVGFDMTKVEYYNCHRRVGIGGYVWSFRPEEGITNFVLMAYTSQGSSRSDSEVFQMGLESLEARNFVPTVVASKSGHISEVNVPKLSSRAGDQLVTVRPDNTACP